MKRSDITWLITGQNTIDRILGGLGAGLSEWEDLLNISNRGNLAVEISIIDLEGEDNIQHKNPVSDSLISNTYLYVRDKTTGYIHRIGDDRHDCITVNDKGQICYQNLQNCDGCRTGYDNGGYEFVPNEDDHGFPFDPRVGE